MKIMRQTLLVASIAGMLFAGCAGGQLTSREKGAGVGVLGGAAAGGLIGATMGRPAAGAAIGGAVGLGAGALVGDYLQGQQEQQEDRPNQPHRASQY